MKPRRENGEKVALVLMGAGALYLFIRIFYGLVF